MVVYIQRNKKRKIKFYLTILRIAIINGGAPMKPVAVRIEKPNLVFVYKQRNIITLLFRFNTGERVF